MCESERGSERETQTSKDPRQEARAKYLIRRGGSLLGSQGLEHLVENQLRSAHTSVSRPDRTVLEQGP